MAVSAFTSVGQQGGSGDERALFLKVFSGEVLKSFHAKTKTLSRHMIRTITQGKSAQFPVIGKANAKYHAAGQNILLDSEETSSDDIMQSIVMEEQVINVDKLLTSATFVDSLEELMNHYDVRGPYANELGSALANQFDTNVMVNIGLGAAASETISGVTGTPLAFTATVSTAPTFAQLIDFITQAAERFDNNGVPEEDRYLYLRPQEYNTLLFNGNDLFNIINKDVAGANGDIASGVARMIMGFELVKTPRLPSTDLSSPDLAGRKNVYELDCSDLWGLACHKSAVGTVKLKDIFMESEYKIEYQGDLMVAGYAMGHKWLRPEACASFFHA